MAERELEALYLEAQSALKARNYDHAAELLKQILREDHEYRDVSRLLAETVKMRRRRWYNHPLLWSMVGLTILSALGFFVAPRMKEFDAAQASATVVPVSSTATLPPTAIPTATETLLPTPMPVPLTWKRISLGQDFERDTVTAFAIDPKDPDVLYTSMENAGIYKSIDGGLSWRPAHHGLANAHVKSLLIDSQNPQILYASTIGGVFKTEDGSENWYKVGEGNYLLMDPQDSSHLYARDTKGIYESTDQGNTWETIYSTKEDCPGEILGWAIHPTDGDTLFVSGGELCEPGVYSSSNGEHTWKLIEKIFVRPGWNIHDLGLDGLFVGLDRQGNLCMESGIDGMPHEGTSRCDQTSYDKANSSYGYCPPHFCKTNPDGIIIRLGKPDVGVITSITISPHDPAIIYVTGKGISVSKDGGLTWTKSNNGLGFGGVNLTVGSGDVLILYVQPTECGEVVGHGKRTSRERVGRDDAGQPLYVSRNGGQSWDLSISTGCYLIQDADASTLYRIGQDWVYADARGEIILRWLWRSKDQGKTWQVKYIAIGDEFTVVAHPLQSGILYASNPQSTAWGENKLISEDYGNTWMNADAATGIKSCYGSKPQFIDQYRPQAIDPFDGNHVFVIDNGILFESHDSCDRTSAFATAPNVNMNSIAFDPNSAFTIYAGADSGAFVSFDGGQTWNEINDGLLGATVVYSIVVDKDSNVYAATPYGIFKLESK